jgi:hypothetical protein
VSDYEGKQIQGTGFRCSEVRSGFRIQGFRARILKREVVVFLLLLVILLWPVRGLAIQVHAEPEGLYSHQIGHVFFVFSMAVFAFWLQKTRLASKRGWRYIQISCAIFILWNLGAMAGHMLDSRLPEDAFVRIAWGRALVIEKAFAPYLHYFLKMDHLIAVPAMIFLLLGLNRLKEESEETRS